jgi:hypothetical protein
MKFVIVYLYYCCWYNVLHCYSEVKACATKCVATCTRGGSGSPGICCACVAHVDVQLCTNAFFRWASVMGWCALDYLRMLYVLLPCDAICSLNVSWMFPELTWLLQDSALHPYAKRSLFSRKVFVAEGIVSANVQMFAPRWNSWVTKSDGFGGCEERVVYTSRRDSRITAK